MKIKLKDCIIEYESKSDGLLICKVVSEDKNTCSVVCINNPDIMGGAILKSKIKKYYEPRII